MTDKQQSIFFFLIVFLFACGAGLLVYKQYADYYQQKAEIDLEAASTAVPINKPSAPTVLADGRLQVDNPKEGGTVGQTFAVSGYAQGWFEGSIAIKVFDNNNQLLYQGNAIAGDNYGHPAPFSSAITLSATSTTPTGKIEFNDYSAKDGSLIYQKVVNIKFVNYAASGTSSQSGVQGWETYQNDQYGFELQYPPDWNFEMMPRYNKDGSVAVGLFDFAFTHLSSLDRMFVSPLGGSAYSSNQLKKTENLDMNGSTVRESEFGDANGTYGIIVDRFNNTQYPLFEIWLGPINANEYLSLKDITQFDQILSTFKFTK